MFFFNDTATTEIYTLSLHDALPILTMDIVVLVKQVPDSGSERTLDPADNTVARGSADNVVNEIDEYAIRSEEHTSELQSRLHLVCRLLLEKKKKKTTSVSSNYTKTK